MPRMRRTSEAQGGKVKIALLEPEIPGNIGAVARVMKNFGFRKLVLINPQCDHLSDEAVARSKHAKNLLRSAKTVDKISSLKYDYIIGTTGKTGGKYNVNRLPVTPENLFNKIPKNSEVIILFGREGIGMTNDELDACDMVVNIPMPSNSRYPVLNLSHAVAIILYELSRAKQKKFSKASKKERDAILLLAGDVIKMIKWSKSSSPEAARKVLKNVINRAFIHKREAYTLAGLFRKIRYELKKRLSMN